MDRARFEEPVTLLVGMGFPARIESATEAYALLQDWPAANRNHTHAVALNACRPVSRAKSIGKRCARLSSRSRDVTTYWCLT